MKTKQPCLATFVSFLIALVSLVIALAWQNLNISNWKLVISLKNQMYIHNITESYRYRYHFQFHDSQLDVIHSHAACLCHLPMLHGRHLWTSVVLWHWHGLHGHSRLDF